MRDFRVRSTNLRILAGVSLAAVWLGQIASPARAQDVKSETAITVAMATDTAPKTRPAQSTYKPYFLEFRARSAATYGHMYVLYGKVNSRNEIVSSDIAGLHPAGDKNDCENCSVVGWTLGHLLFVPSETGASDGDLEEKYVSARYRVMVDAPTFKKVSAYIAKLKADNPMWNAIWRNCVSFGNDIAENAGLKTPGFALMEPADYVARLRELNGGKPQGPLRYAAGGAGKSKPASAETVAVPRKKRPVADLKSSKSDAGPAQ